MFQRARFLRSLPPSVILALAGFGLVIFLTLGIPIVLVLEKKAIHGAVRKGDVTRIEQILDRHPDRLEQRSRLDLTPLHQATWYGQSEALRVLVRRGANVNATWGSVATGDGAWNGLHIASNFGRSDAARILLAAGTDVNRRTLKGETPLDIALRNGEGDVAELLRAGGGLTAARPAAGR